MAYVAQSIIRRAIGRIMSTHGELMTLQRTGSADVSVRGKRVPFKRGGSVDVVNSLSDAELLLRIGNDELAAAAWGLPKRGDTITNADARPYTVLHVDTIRHDGEILGHHLLVTG